jgi:TonB family protein
VAVAVGFRRHVRTGPALRIVPLPVAGLTLSTLLHGMFIVAAVIAVKALHESQPTAYFVNLVPAVPAVGSPQGVRSAPRPAPVPTKAPEIPTREAMPPAPRDVPSPAPRDLPAPAPRDLPPRDLPARPLALPERSLPSRTTPLAPRPEQKELPTVASRSSTPPATPPSSSSTPRDLGSAPPAPPPPPAGLPSGSAQGAGKVTLDVDFPYAWYLRRVADKINERWDGFAQPGNQPIVAFEIDRAGQVPLSKVTVEKSSGNPAYDRIAVRAILDSNPFPPLPEDFKAAYLTVHLQFNYSRGG